MKYTIGTSPRDAEAARRDIQRTGERDGHKNWPPVDPSGGKVKDYVANGLAAEATSTASLTTAGHVATQRVEDDTALGNARASTARWTARTRDSRQVHEDALAEERAYEQRLPLSAKLGFYWHRYAVWSVLFALGIASGAAVIAALGSVTTDSGLLSDIIGTGVAVAAVAGGASLGSLLRRRDLDHIQSGRYSSSGFYSLAVILIGLLGLIAIAVGVAGLRDAASKADAARRAARTQIQVFIPGQPQSPSATPAPATTSQGVDWPTWLAFELGLIAAALSVEFQRADVRAEHREELKRNARTSHGAWTTEHTQLTNAVAQHEVAAGVRADHDGSVILTGSGNAAFNGRLANDYRHSNLAQRAQGGDPFDKLDVPGTTELEQSFNANPGVDVVALATHAKADEGSGSPFLEQLRDDHLLKKAYDELGQAPNRPKRADSEPWTPGASLALDSSAQALTKVLDGVGSNGNARPEGDGATSDHEASASTSTALPDDLVAPPAGNGAKS